MDLSELHKNFKPINFQTSTPQPQKKKKNFWLDQLSTIGGIGGGIAGSFFSPIIGTGIGAGFGSGIGESLENAIMGESLGQNVGKEAALGAVFGAGPLKLLKGAGAGAKAIATGADDVVGAASKAALTPLRKKAGEGLVKAGDNLAIKQFRLTPSQLKNFKGKFGEDAGQVIRKYGFQNVDDVAVKGIEPLQQQFDDLVAGIPGVTKESLTKSLNSKISSLLKAAPSDSKALGKQLKKEANDLLKPFGDVIDAKELNAIRQQFDQLVNYTEKVANPSRYGVNKRMADALRETLQAADQTGSLKTTGKELQKLRQLSENVLKQDQLGRGSLPFGLSGLPGAVMGASFANPFTAAGGYALTQGANSKMGRRALSAGADKIGGKLASTKGGQSPLGIAGRVGAAGIFGGAGNQSANSLEEAIMDQSSKNSMPTTTTNPMSSMAPTNANMGSPYSNSSEMSSSPFAPQNLEQAITQIMEQGGRFKDVKEFLTIAQTFNSLIAPQASEQKAGYGRPSAQQYSQGTTGLESVATIEQMLQENLSLATRNATPGQNIPGIGGLVSGAVGTSEYRAAANNILNSIARINTGANMPESEEAFYNRTYLPQPGDDPATIQSKIQRLRDFFSPIVNYQGAGGGLEEALMAAQGAY